MDHSKIVEVLIDLGSVLFVFIAIGFCIFIHEFGHFVAAKMRGLHVDAFALGFRPFWRKKYKGVEYRLGYLPFGGYCEIPQVDATAEIPKSADGTELPRAKPLDRIITALFGPLFNIISGLLLACIIWIHGMPQDSPRMREIQVLEVEAESPEYLAGLRPGDRIVKINGESFFDTWSEFVKRILFTIGEVKLTVERDGKLLQISYLPQVNPNAPGALKTERMAWPFFRPLIPIEMMPRPGSPAAKAGITPGDYLISVNGEPVTDLVDFQLALNQTLGKPVKLTLRRGDQTVDVELSAIPVPGTPEESCVYQAGFTFNPMEKELKVLAVNPDYPAAKAGILVGDVITDVSGEAIDNPLKFSEILQKFKSEPVELTIRRDGKTEKLTLSAVKVIPLTIGVDFAIYDHPNPFQQFLSTIELSYKSLRGILVSAANRLHLTSQQSTINSSHMSGPLGMGLVLFNMVQSSFILAVYFVVVISFALAIFNLLPFPVLDGGHILFGVIEIIIRGPVPQVIIKYLSAVFVALLISLMLYVTFFDGRRIYFQFFPEKPAETTAGAPDTPVNATPANGANHDPASEQP